MLPWVLMLLKRKWKERIMNPIFATGAPTQEYPIKRGRKRKQTESKIEYESKSKEPKQRESSQLLEIFTNWIDFEIKRLNQVYCARELTHNEIKLGYRDPLPLDADSMAFIFQCAKEMMLEFVTKHPSILRDEMKFNSLALASLLNSLILTGFEDHCRMDLEPEFQTLLKHCKLAACKNIWVKHFQLALLMQGSSCAKMLHPQLSS